MQFRSADPSVVRSVTQRVLLNAWLRALRMPDALPLLCDFDTEGTADERADMMSFDVVGSGEAARFLITQEGARLTTAYGNEHVEPPLRTNRYLDDAIGPERYAGVILSYRACLARRRPTYTVAEVTDADGKEVSYERLLLPFGRGDAVEHIIGSYKAISIEGGFRLHNLMGVAAKSAPVVTERAVIDRRFVPTDRPVSHDSVELI
ncbi:hypothetical protein AB7M49_007433 [Bradyrhizobium elkanii]|jgi:hypothetical protein|uniref:hypothetical protein n=1 Tax=Bradyrhizobium TaxID=374 RepID=UPI000841FEB2|nr:MULTISPECIES: hypothetical protein [Bradyrhizobium]MCP1931165.1 hypothetical protein [Bradyrhizobium elkanii]MCS3480710.1 hypothetical protein [Bradyrhizobium elkanii]MCS3517518.1 hypothetical protein [Bradyrhizobium elkanii]MCS3578309.1 hypothetical protein [Bradyrhizobium elkanii]MCS3721182.1 hypothetical protein [Bradyrhizobium elkanii]